MNLLAAMRERVVLGDGAMGTSLLSCGVPFSACLEELNLSNPSMVRRIHDQYREAGAELIETNTFGANAARLARHGLQNRCAEINRAGVAIARAAAGGQGRVAGSVGPLGENRGDGASEIFREQIAALAEAGADLIVLETFQDLSELHAALVAARAVCDLPVLAQVSPDERGNLPGGIQPEEYARRLNAWGADVIGCNCGSGMDSLLDAIRRMARSMDKPLAAQPSAGLPVPGRAPLEYPCSPEMFAAAALSLAESGVSLLGGCCGTTPAHIRAAREALAHNFAPARNARLRIAL